MLQTHFTKQWLSTLFLLPRLGHDRSYGTATLEKQTNLEEILVGRLQKLNSCFSLDGRVYLVDLPPGNSRDCDRQGHDRLSTSVGFLLHHPPPPPCLSCLAESQSNFPTPGEGGPGRREGQRSAISIWVDYLVTSPHPSWPLPYDLCLESSIPLQEHQRKSCS